MKLGVLVVSICAALSAALFFGAAPAMAAGGFTVYDAIPSTLPPNVASLGFQSNHTAEFGDYVHLAGTARTLASVTVTLSDHAVYSDYSSDVRYAGDSVNWTHPITLNVYNNHLDANGVPDQLIATQTDTVTIPWLPPGFGFSGIAFNATFDMSSLNVTLPDDVIVSVAFNTETFGSAPIGTSGPYISLNVGAPTGGVTTVGTDDSTDAVFLNGNNAAAYDNGCPGAVIGQFCQDTGWTPNGTLPFLIKVKDTTAPTVTVTAASPIEATGPSGAVVTYTVSASDPDDAAGTPNCDIPSGATLAVGSHLITCTSTDSNGNVGTGTATVVVQDTTPPDTSIDTHPADPSSSSAASFTFSATETSTFECSLDGGGFSACTSPKSYTGLADGSHTFQVRATDTAGNTDPSPAAYTWTIDTSAPQTAIDSHPTNPTDATDATFTFHATEAATFECSLDGSPFTACSSPQTYTGLSEGSHSFEVRATDAVGNTDPSPATFNWTNGHKPKARITATPPRHSHSTTAEFTFTADDPSATFQCSLDGEAFTACTGPVTYTGLASGKHTFRVKAFDAAGRTSKLPTSYSWKIT